MLSRPQIILLKRAQAAAGLGDAEYRQSLSLVTGLPLCHSSKDPRLTDRHLDNLLSYFEAIHWRGVDACLLHPDCAPHAVFPQRAHWANKNPSQNTSRDRFTASQSTPQIASLESEMRSLGYSDSYLAAIRRRAGHAYPAALSRTLAARRKASQPF